MRRSPLRRYTPLRSHSRLQAHTPLRKRARRPKAARIAAPEYLAWIRTQPCLAAGRACFGAIQAHHHGHGTTRRQNDYTAVPLCLGHHLCGPNAVHRIGVPRFEAFYGVRFETAIQGLNDEYEARRAA